MKLKEVTVEISGKAITVYRLGDCMVASVDNDSVQGYPITGKYFKMACNVAKQAGITLQLDEADVLCELLEIVAEGVVR